MRAEEEKPTVYVVDDDVSVREALKRSVRLCGVAGRAVCFRSGLCRCALLAASVLSGPGCAHAGAKRHGFFLSDGGAWTGHPGGVHYGAR